MQNRYDKCPNCMKPLEHGEDTCPYCGFDVSGYEEKPNCLRPFSILQGKYVIGRVIGMGGFGITYIGWDLNLQTYIAIKEYYPESFAYRDSTVDTTVTTNGNKQEIYNKGLTRYVEEARNLSKFYQLQGIVSVKDFFYENGTGYIVMEYINGVNLKEYLNGMGGKLDEATVLSLMKPVFESLYEVHKNGLVHRDISPDNIMVDNEGKIKLIDFGSVRGQSSETDKTYTVILKHGYAPPEQYYAKGKQGPWTDIYSLCATMYKMLTGQVPPNGVERMEDDTYEDPSKLGIQVSPRTEAVLRRGLAVKAQDRYQHIGELLADLYGTGPVSQTNATPQSNPFVAPGAVSVSASGQSMHLAPSEQKPEGEAKKKKTILIAGITAGVVALIVGLILIIGGGKNDKSTTEKTEAPATETDTSADKTTESTEKADVTTEAGIGDSGDSGYVWPTELSDSWRDYTVKIDGTVYKFPMPYSEFESKGWEEDNAHAKIAAGKQVSSVCYTDRAKITAIIVNPALKEAGIRDCYVVGFSFDYYDGDCKDDFTIELAGGIELLKSTEADIKTAFGAPEYRYDGDLPDDKGTYIALDYAGESAEDGMDLTISENDNLTSIKLVNTKLPENATSISDLNTQAPSINSLYVAPTGPSADRFDNIITIGDKNYVLPVTFSELEKDGWALDSSVANYISGNSYEFTSMEKNGEKLDITLENFTTDAILPQYGYITKIAVDEKYYSGTITFPGGISVGDDAGKFEEIYSDLGEDYSKDEYDSFISYNAYKSTDDDFISINMYADPETGKITEYTYSSGKEIK